MASFMTSTQDGLFQHGYAAHLHVYDDENEETEFTKGLDVMCSSEFCRSHVKVTLDDAGDTAKIRLLEQRHNIRLRFLNGSEDAAINHEHVRLL